MTIILMVVSVVILALYIGWGIKLVIFGIPPSILCLLIIFCFWIGYPVWCAVKQGKSASAGIWHMIAAVVMKMALLLVLVGAYVFGPVMAGSRQFYLEAAEPKTGRVFVAECFQNMMNRGSVQLYERHGPFIVPCDTEMFIGEFLTDEPRIYLTDDGTEIYITFFFALPYFLVPAF